MAVDYSGNALSWNGSSWSAPVSIDSNGYLDSVSCPSVSFCMAVDYSGNALSWNGSSWSAPVSIDPNSGLDSVSCPSVSFCMAVDENGNALTWNGSSWSAPVSIDSNGYLDSVSCPSVSFCMAVDGYGNALTWNGSSWSAPASIDPSGGYLTSVSCPSVSFCMAVDGSGNALSWNGSSWSAPASIGGYLSSVSCPSASFCMAVDGSANALSWNGSSWSAPASIDPSGGLSSVSCPSASFCVAVDENGNALSWNGSSWSAPTSIDSNGGGLNSVSCPSASFCVAVDENGNALSWNGSSWSAPTSIDPNNVPTSVSCPSASFCMAVDGSGNALSWNGSSWSAPASIDPSGGYLSSVSCASSSFCMAVGALDGNFYALSWNGTSWSAPINIDGMQGFESLSCPSESFCMAVGGDHATGDQWASFDGTHWSVAQSLPATDGGGAEGFAAVSCTTASFCMAIDGGAGVNGDLRSTSRGPAAFAWSGSSWSAPTVMIDATTVSCASSQFCMAVGDGDAYTYASQGATDIAQVTGVAGIPTSGVQAVTATVTVTDTKGDGYLTIWPEGAPRPLASTLNWTSGQTVANSVEIPVSSSGQVALFNGSSGTADVILDVTGWFGVTTSTSTPSGAFVPIAPARIADTRCSALPQPPFCAQENLPVVNQDLTAIPAGSHIRVQVTGTAAIPTEGVTAVVANFTVTDTSESGYLTVWPAGESMPVVSTLNWTADETVASAATVPLPASGAIDVYNSSSSPVDLVVDVSGYYSTGATATWATFTPLTPARICDTRPSSVSGIQDACTGHPLQGNNGNTLVVAVEGTGGVPATGVGAVALNVTVVDPTGAGYLTITPDGQTRPVVSSVNFTAGETVANLVVATLGADGKIDIAMGSAPGASADVVVDVTGYDAALALDPPTPPVAVVGDPYTFSLNASGGIAPYHWSLTGGSLPSGLSLDPSTGVISGTPTTTADNVSIGIEVSDSTSPDPQVAEQAFTLSVAEPGVPLITSVSPVANISNPSVVVKGTNFGQIPAVDLNQATTTPYLEVFSCPNGGSCSPSDPEDAAGWTSGYSGAQGGGGNGGDSCQLDITSWSDTEIQFQFLSDALCAFATGDELGVLVWDASDPVSQSNDPGSPGYTTVVGGYVWGYCLNAQAGEAGGYLDAQGWGCAVESSPSDVALLWSGSAGSEPPPDNVGNALQEISNGLGCTIVCASGGIFAFGADATATSQLGSPASFQSVTVGASADLEIGLGLSGGEAATLFSNGTASDSVTGLLAGISVSACAGCVDFPVGLSFGVGPLDWSVQPLSDSSAATVNQGLQDMKTATMLACLTVTAACPLAIGPYVGYFGPELATAFADLQQVLAVP